jgi:putative endonuclease
MEAWLNADRWILLQIQSLAERFARKPALPKHLRIGQRGEFEALYFLRRQGFCVAARRWRSPELRGDLDLVAWENGTLCFVEVKTRTKRDLTPAAAAIDDGKRRMLREMAQSYLRMLPARQRSGLLIRFDVISVYLVDGEVQCELVRDAFPRQPGHFRDS